MTRCVGGTVAPNGATTVPARFLLRSLLALFLIVSAAAVLEAQTPVVTRAPDAAARLSAAKGLAILPIENCPGALDCAQIEQKLYSSVFEQRARWPWKPAVLSALKAREKLMELRVEDTADRNAVASALGVQVLLIPAVPYLGAQAQPQTLLTPAGNAPEARVEMTLLEAGEGGKTLFRGSIQRRATTYSLPEGLVSSLFRQLMGEVFPKEQGRQ
jgi:hypothetical protein